MLNELHDLMESSGKAATIAALGIDRRHLADAAAGFLGDERHALAFVFSGWCLAALPHRKLANNVSWRLESGRVVLLVEPGRRMLPGIPDEFLGVPYGAIARLILIFLQREAVRTNNRTVELGGSMRQWLGLLGMSVGGKTMNLVREQVQRISTCRFTLQAHADGNMAVKNAAFVQEALLFAGTADHRQGSLFPDRVTLTEEFYSELRAHPVPLDEAALRQLRRSSMALDAYLWLAYRLHSLRGPTRVSWRALKAQFGGGGYRELFAFRQQFREALELALSVYPDAARHGVRIADDGLVLSPVAPPVSRIRNAA